MSPGIDRAAAAPMNQPNKLKPAASRSTAHRPGRTQPDIRPQLADPSLGELKAQHRELHLCFRCTHHMVCGMANSLDANLLVTIASCLAFDPEDSEPSDAVCELLPIEPLPST